MKHLQEQIHKNVLTFDAFVSCENSINSKNDEQWKINADNDLNGSCEKHTGENTTKYDLNADLVVVQEK